MNDQLSGGLVAGGITVVSVIILLVFFLVGLLVNFIPSIVAFRRNHEHRIAILLINIFLSWTVAAWIITLIWALSGSSSQPQTTVIVQQVPAGAPQAPGAQAQIPAGKEQA